MARYTRPDTPALLFDLDGVLIDSTPSQIRAWEWWCESYGLDPAPFLAAHGMTGTGKIAHLTPAHMDLCPATEAAKVTAYELTDTCDVVAHVGAAEMLAAAELVGVVTSAETSLARARMGAAGLAVPGLLVGAEMVKNGKPDPEPYALAANRLGVPPQRCVAFEDAPAGIHSAKQAGAYVVAVTTTLDALHLTRADLIVDSLAEYLHGYRACGV